MQSVEQYKAQRISKQRAEDLKKHGRLGGSLLMDLFNGFLLVEPADRDLGDGEVLSPPEADYELQPAWYQGPPATLREARRRLGLEAGILSETTA
jgi:hypothetical protein